MIADKDLEDYNFLEKSLNELSISINNKNKELIPDKNKFFIELHHKIEKINKKEKLDKQILKPLSSFWERFLFGKYYFRWIVAFSFVFIFFIGLFFIINHNFYNTATDNFYPLEEEPKFGTKNGNNKDLPDSEEVQNKIEEELINKILEEEDPKKKEQWIHQLIEFYKKTKQEYKIDMFLQNLE